MNVIVTKNVKRDLQVVKAIIPEKVIPETLVVPIITKGKPDRVGKKRSPRRND